MKKTYLAWVLLAASVTATSLAQPPQTPENAHRFITLLSQQGSISYSPADHFENITAYSASGSTREKRWLRPRSLHVIDSKACRTDVNVGSVPSASETLPTYRRRDAAPLPDDRIERPFVRELSALAAHGIDWSRVTRLDQKTSEDGPGVLVAQTGAGPSITLYFASPELAARAVYALDVIRRACDPAAETGF